jgi:4-amino-4-deoxy-L-arabinose transferase-like glycosyltransferase
MTAAAALWEWMVRRRYAIAFGLVLILHVIIRTRFINHQLIVDEANNFLCLNTLGGRFPGYPFNLMFNYHPPLYLVFALALSRITGIYTMGLYEGFSIVLSALALFPLYLLTNEIFNRRTALLSCFALALMPAAMVMDTWIKVDPLEVLFALWFVYFFVKGRPLVSGVFFALALLSKETVLLVLLGLAAYLLLSRERNRLKVLLYACIAGALLSCWWFIFYYDNLGRFFSVLMSTHTESLMDNFGAWYYITGLFRDLGIFFLIAAAGGFVYCCYCFFAKKHRL